MYVCAEFPSPPHTWCDSLDRDVRNSTCANGVVTSRSRVRNRINQFLSGYIASQNRRFRDHELTFKLTTSDYFAMVDDKGEGSPCKPKDRMGQLRYPGMIQTRHRINDEGKVTSKFTLHVKSGTFRDGECIALMGENGTGKTTFMEMLAGRIHDQRGIEATIRSYEATNNGGGESGNPSLAAFGVSYKMEGLNP